MRDSTSLALRLALSVALVLPPVASAAPPAAADETIVHVSANGTAYHREDCRRLRFGVAMKLAEARGRYTPCMICTPPPLAAPSAAPAAIAVVAPPARPVPAPRTPPPAPVVKAEVKPQEAASAPAPTATPAAGRRPETTKRKGRHGWLGLAIGAAGGAAIGALLAKSGCEDEEGYNDCHPSIAPMFIGGGLAAGAFLGFVAGGGFSEERIDQALARDRERLRSALAAAREPVRPPTP